MGLSRTAVLATARTLCGLVIFWHCIVLVFAPPRYILPAPFDVLAALWTQRNFLWANTLVTLSEIAAGFVIGSLLGIATAIGTAAFPKFGKAVWPLVLVTQAFPVFVIAPLLVLWFGFGMASKVVMTTLIIFFPIASAFADGLRRTDRDLIDATALTPATHLQTLIHIRLPLAMPALVSGLKVAAPLAPLGAVIGEWVGASAGLGFVMIQANARLQTDTMFAAMTIIAILTLVLRWAVERAEPLFVPWERED